MLPSRRLTTSPAERRTARCWLMFGTWQLASRERSLTECSPFARTSSTHRRLGSASARLIGGDPLALWVRRDLDRPDGIGGVSISLVIERMFSLLAQGRNCRSRVDRAASHVISVVAELVETVVTDAGVVRELVDDRASDLVGELVGIGEVGLERQPEERDLVRVRHQVSSVLDRWDALVEPVQPGVVVCTAEVSLLGRRQLVDDDRDVLEEAAERLRQPIERALDEDLERLVALRWQRDASVGMTSSEGSAASHGHRVSMLRSVTAPGVPRARRSSAGEPEPMVVQLASGSGSPISRGLGRTTRGRSLLVHGLSRTSWTWLPVARRLAGRHPIVAPDLRGHGASDAPREGYDLESLALDMLTVVAAQGWGAAVGGPAVVVAGHGLGAIVAVEAARLEPASVAGLVLVDGGWEEVGETTRLSAPELIAAMADPPEVLASMETYLADRREFDPASWDADQERAARAAVVERHAGHVSPVVRASVTRRLVDTLYAYRPSTRSVGCRSR